MNKKIVFLLVIFSLILFTLPALANGPGWDPGKKAGTWLTENLQALFIPAIVGFAILFLIKRQVVAFIGFLVFALIVSVFVFSPETVTTRGKEVGGWFLSR